MLALPVVSLCCQPLAVYKMPVLLDSLQDIHHLSLDQSITFIALASRLKNDIVLAQPSSHSPTNAPPLLLLSVTEFLASACQLGLDDVGRLWERLRDMIWSTDPAMYSLDVSLRLFHQHGHLHGLSK